jgi:ATP-dependent 26S proteasome regulatory subunit
LLKCLCLLSWCDIFLQVDPVVYNMLHEDPGNISYSAVGGLSDQIRELRESIELPLMNPELFIRVGIKPPKVISFKQILCWLVV